MLARLRKATEENEGGFTLIELLVVMIIIGILAAIAIPAFLNQKRKAGDTSAKADVTTIGKNIAAYYVDQAAALTITGTGGAWSVNNGATVVDSGKLSKNNSVDASPANVHATSDTDWCVSVNNSVSAQSWKYSSQGGLATGACAAADK